MLFSLHSLLRLVFFFLFRRTIYLRSNSSLLLTVGDPRLNSGKHAEDNCVGYEGCAVLVMPRKPFNGNANQLWSYDSNSCLLFPFATEAVNKGI